MLPSTLFPAPRLIAAVAITAVIPLVAIGTEPAAGHRSLASPQIKIVSAGLDYPGDSEIHVRSRRSKCIKRRPIQLRRDGVILWANETNDDGVAVGYVSQEPARFGEEYAGATVVVRGFARKRRGHKHGCRTVRKQFQPADSAASAGAS